jgi:uncharacterized protein
MPTIAALHGALAERIAARFGSPRVRALDLPPHQAATAKDAELCASELEDGSIGSSYVEIDAVEPMLRLYRDAGAVAGTEAAVLARGFAGQDPAAKALAFAAINALSQDLL